MNVDLTVQLGFHGRRRSKGAVRLSAASVGGASAWAGSYHVLFMGRHYDDYVVTRRVIQFPPIPGLPPIHGYRRLTGKIRAASVTGNIGESVAAIVARRKLKLAITEIVPMQPDPRLRSPDYLMLVGPHMPALFRRVIPVGRSFQWPNWWPVESKARTTEEGARTARRDALRQLAAYWSALTARGANTVGFGIVVTLVFHPPREVLASLIIPRRQQRLRTLLTGRDVRDIADHDLTTCLYEC